MSLYDHSKSYVNDPSFGYMPITTLDSSDFSGAACIIYKNEKAKIDLIVHSVDFSFAENFQITPHMGDTYSTVFFGKAPLEVTIEASLPDSIENFGKTNLLNAYKNYYRVSAVARSRETPTFVCKNMQFSGPFTKLVITEDSESCDTCSVVITMLVMKLEAMGDNSKVSIDFVHAQESAVVESNQADDLKATQTDVTVRKVSASETSGSSAAPVLVSTDNISRE